MSKNIYKADYKDGSLDSAINYLGDKININFWDGQTSCYMLDVIEKKATYISNEPLTIKDCEEYDGEDSK